MEPQNSSAPLLDRRDPAFLAYAAITVALRILPVSLRLDLYRRGGPAIGALWHSLARGDARNARENVRAVLGEEVSDDEVKHIARQLFMNLARGKLLNDIYADLGLDGIEAVIQLTGEEHLDAALAQGRGAVLVGNHSVYQGYGPLIALKRLGYDVTAVLGEEIEHDSSRIYQRLVFPVRQRSRRDLDILAPNGQPQRVVADCLRQNRMLLILADVFETSYHEDVSMQSEVVPFFSGTVLMKTGPFRLSRWMHVPLIPYFLYPSGSGFAMVMEPPLPFGGDNGDGLIEMMHAYAALFESNLRRCPEGWMHWRHDRLLDFVEPAGQLSAVPQ